MERVEEAPSRTRVDGGVDRGSESELAREAVAPVVVATFLLAFLVGLRTWVADDAYITMRVVDNVVHGFGLRYNVVERVQVFTHPLWALLLIGPYAILRSAWWTLAAGSLLASAATVGVLVRNLPISRLHATVGVVWLASSVAFVDFSSSGLENAMTHLLLVAFGAVWFRSEDDRLPLFSLSWLAALAVMNRMDTGLIYLPALAMMAASAGFTRRLFRIVLGFAPFLAWEIFALGYYGTPFPNTAYAKLGGGVPRSDLTAQGLEYLADSLVHDPVTLVAAVGTLTLVLVRGNRRAQILALGAVLYLSYVVSIGGDFMRGRFLTPLIAVAVLLVVRRPLRKRTLIWLLVVPAGVAGAYSWPSAFGHDPGEEQQTGIVDERAFYEGRTDLLSMGGVDSLIGLAPDRSWAEGEMPTVRLAGAIGLRGFSWGPGVHVVDYLGLADPLLARLPTQDADAWRIGHLERRLPIGYLETLETGRDQFRDRELREYYDLVAEVTRGEPWTTERWGAILDLNLGRMDHLVDREEYSRAWAFEVDIGPEQTRVGSRSGAVVWPLPARNGVLLRLGGARRCSTFEMGLVGDASYRLTYYRGGEPLRDASGRVHHLVPDRFGPTVRAHPIEVPPEISDRGFDALLVFPLAANVSRIHGFAWLELPQPAPPVGFDRDR